MRTDSADSLGYSGIDRDREGHLEPGQARVQCARDNQLNRGVRGRRQRTCDRAGAATGLGRVIEWLRRFIGRIRRKVVVGMMARSGVGQRPVPMSIMGVLRTICVRCQM